MLNIEIQMHLLGGYFMQRKMLHLIQIKKFIAKFGIGLLAAYLVAPLF